MKYERSDAARTPGALAGRIAIVDDFDELPDDIADDFGVHEP